MDNDYYMSDRSNSYEITSRFSSNPTNGNPREEKLNLLKSHFQQLIKLAEKKYFNDFLTSRIFKKKIK